MSWNLSSAKTDPTQDTAWQRNGRTVAESELWNLLRNAEIKLRQEPDEAQGYLERAIALIEAEYSAQNEASPKPKGGLAGWQIRDIKVFVDNNLRALIRTSQLAEVAKLSISHFSRAFKQSFGESPTSYIACRRVDLARQLILRTDLPLSEIALECGLCDQSHLSRIFKRVVGSSPLDWRRRNSTGPKVGHLPVLLPGNTSPLHTRPPR